ncbi:transcriptional regulator [Luteimicrobium album]|uniref:Transcriptional regulator n=1 Tax=Luteimicrobium album TaxID=1054550 RepID=A0ABQ6I1H3_9MICO|nr:mobile mystery protein A [Luteimicrobium album]GMA23625.1 transcriptional regulator [Luteimicrobium album]
MSNAEMIRRSIDRRVEPLRKHSSATARPAGGWVRAVRSALGMSTTDLARRLGVTPVAVRKLEASERNGVVRLDTLTRAADAMGCDVVYAFVPRTSLEEFVEVRAQERADTELGQVDTTMALEAQRTSQAERAHLRDQLAAELTRSSRLWRDPS